jgi:hypothetical protein
MFGCLPLDEPHREGGLLAGLWTYFPFKSHNLDATTFLRGIVAYGLNSKPQSACRRAMSCHYFPTEQRVPRIG